MKLIDLTGKTFGRLTVIERHGPKGRRAYWRCKCECGNETVVVGDTLKSGRTKSCGCLRTEETIKRSTTHGHTSNYQRTREYTSWKHAKERCNNPSNPKYPLYGGRGIKMCERWKKSFSAFMEDMGKCPPGHTLDRIDVNGNYEPNNCRWASPKSQGNNTRKNVIVSLHGENMTLKQAAHKLGINYKSIHAAIKYGGLSFDAAITKLSA
jgi:hypothetical protein